MGQAGWFVEKEVAAGAQPTLKGQEITVTIIHTNVQSATYDEYGAAIQTCNFNISSLDQRMYPNPFYHHHQ